MPLPIKQYKHMFKDVKFLATTAQPSYKEVSHWIDLLEDPTGGTIKVWNGAGWKKISGEGDSDTGLVIGDTTGTAYDGGKGKAVEDKLSEGFIINHYLNNDLSNGNEIVLTRIGISGENGEKYSAQDTIPSATTTKAGVMSANDKKKLDSLSTESDVYVIDWLEQDGMGGFSGNPTSEQYEALVNAVSLRKIIIIYVNEADVYYPKYYYYDGADKVILNFEHISTVTAGGTLSTMSLLKYVIRVNSNLSVTSDKYIRNFKYNGYGTKFLSDDGTYKAIEIPDISNLATKTELNAKVSTETYNADKATFALKNEIPTDAPSDGSTYGRNNGAWIKVEMPDVSEFITETEADGKYATPALVDSKVAALVNSAPAALDTLKELADALGNDANFSTTITTKLGEKVDKTTYESDKAGFATKTELANKLDTSTYNSDKAGFATKTELNNKKNITTVQEVADASSSASFNLDPNTLKKMGEVGTITVLGFTTTGLQSNELAEYAFEFKSGDTPTVLTMPESVKWIGDHTIEANKTYQVSIVNNLAVMGGA